MSKNGKSSVGEAFVVILVFLFGTLPGWFILIALGISSAAAIGTIYADHWSPRAQGLPSVISTQELAGKTIKDAAAKRCFTVVQQDGQPRFVPADCPKGK